MRMCVPAYAAYAAYVPADSRSLVASKRVQYPRERKYDLRKRVIAV